MRNGWTEPESPVDPVSSTAEAVLECRQENKRRHRREIGRRNQRGRCRRKAFRTGRTIRPVFSSSPADLCPKGRAWCIERALFFLFPIRWSSSECTETFFERGLNLCKIESRPSGKKKWDYYFFVDFIGHRDDEKVVEAMQELEKSTSFVKHLGSYPENSS